MVQIREVDNDGGVIDFYGLREKRLGEGKLGELLKNCKWQDLS